MQERTAKDESLCRIKADNREELSSLRKKNREDIIRQRRFKFHPVEAHIDTIPIEEFKMLVLQMKQKKPSVESLKAIKNNCQTSSYIKAFFKTMGAFDSLIKILVGKNAHLQLESVACLTNLACGSHKASHRIARGAGAYLVSFITGGSMYLQDQSAWAAGNIANDCLECFSILKAQGILPALLAALKSPSADVIQSATFALHACTKYGDPDLIELATPETMKLLLQFVKQENNTSNTRSDAAFTLANCYYLLVQNNTDIDCAVVEPILSLLCSISNTNKDVLISLPLVRCLGFLSICDSICQHLSQHASFFSIITPMLSDKILRKEMLWVLTNIVANSGREFLDFNIVLTIVDFLNYMDHFQMIQVLYFLCILVKQNENTKTLLTQQCIFKFIGLCNCGNKTVENASKYLCNMLNIVYEVN